MKSLAIYIFLLISLFTFGQQKNQSNTLDINTIYVTIDTLSYSRLFQNSFIKDTLFFCKNATTKTNSESYSGKYFIGNSATIEFFEPINTTISGDTFGNVGIEFKTRSINKIKFFKNKSNTIDTTFVNYDSIKLPWYQSLKNKHPYISHTEVSVIEYQKEYLEFLGFSDKEINSDMTYNEFNAKVSGGKKYPRKFNTIKSIELNLEKREFEDLKETIINLGGTAAKKILYLNGFEIKTRIKSREHFRVTKITIELLDNVPKRKIKISELISVKTANKIAEITFSNP